MKNRLFSIIIATLILALAGCASNYTEESEADKIETKEADDPIKTDGPDKKEGTHQEEKTSLPDHEKLKNSITKRYQGLEPSDWGKNLERVITEIDTEEKIVALTFDACGGVGGSNYDERLIDFLKKENIPATLFINGRWIKENKKVFLELSQNPLFEIANHGYQHKPLSVSGKTAYGKKGTKNVEEAFDEVFLNHLLIKELTGRSPSYFRSGTAHYDDIAVEIIYELGEKPVNFNVLGDAGGTFTKEEIVDSMLKAEKGAIMLFHMNQPQSSIKEGLKEGVFTLRKEGFDFVKLGDYHHSLR